MNIFILTGAGLSAEMASVPFVIRGMDSGPALIQ